MICFRKAGNIFIPVDEGRLLQDSGSPVNEQSMMRYSIKNSPSVYRYTEGLLCVKPHKYRSVLCSFGSSSFGSSGFRCSCSFFTEAESFQKLINGVFDFLSGDFLTFDGDAFIVHFD